MALFTLQLLKDEIDTDPLTRGYSGMNDVQVAESLSTNLDRTQVPTSVSVDEVRQYIIGQINDTGVDQRSVYGLLKEFAESGTVRGSAAGITAVDARQSAAQMIMFMLELSGGTDSSLVFDVGDTNIRDQFISLGPDGGNGANVFTGAQLTAIDNLRYKTGSRADELWEDRTSVTPSEVAKARALP